MKLIPHRLAAETWYNGIRSLVRKGSRVGPLADSVALPPLPTIRTLTLTALLLPTSRSGARSFPPGSACRHAARTVSSSVLDALRSVSEAPDDALPPGRVSLPADCPHPARCHRLAPGSVGYSEFPAYRRVHA